MSEEIQDWNVAFRIIGPKLPRENIYLEDILFKQIPLDQEILRPGILGSPVPGHTGYGVIYSHISVKSNCYVFIACKAKSPDAARNKAFSEHIPLIQACLSLRDDGLPYQIEFAWAECKTGSTAIGPVVSGTIIDIEEMSRDRFAQASNDYKLLSSNEVAKSCAHRFSTAIQQQASSYSAAEREATLMSYFKVIERIANSFQVSQDEKGQLVEEREAKISELVNELKRKDRSLRLREKAIQAASDALNKLERKYLSLKIEHAANQLGLSNGWLEAATAFNKLRNTHLGHQGSNLSNEVSHEWLAAQGKSCLAHEVARDMLTAYVASLRRDLA